MNYMIYRFNDTAKVAMVGILFGYISNDLIIEVHKTKFEF